MSPDQGNCWPRRRRQHEATPAADELCKKGVKSYDMPLAAHHPFQRGFMESATAAPQLPPQAVVMQMVMGGWIARAISEVSRLDVPDALQRGGPMTAAALVAGGVRVD